MYPIHSEANPKKPSPEHNSKPSPEHNSTLRSWQGMADSHVPLEVGSGVVKAGQVGVGTHPCRRTRSCMGDFASSAKRYLCKAFLPSTVLATSPRGLEELIREKQSKREKVQCSEAVSEMFCMVQLPWIGASPLPHTVRLALPGSPGPHNFHRPFHSVSPRELGRPLPSRSLTSPTSWSLKHKL